MNGSTNIFFSNGVDPLLGGTPNYETRMQELEQAMRYLEQQKQNLVKMQGAPQQSSGSPIWDEIDSLTSKMSEKEFSIMSENDEFIDSSNTITQLVSAMQLAQIRPMVESSQQGRDALEKHLTLIKRLKKSAEAEVNKELEDFKEYTAKYSSMPYEEYKKMKRTKKSK